MNNDQNQTDIQLPATAIYGPHRIVTLGPEHIPAMLALQEQAGQGQIVMRDAQALRAHFAAGHGAIGMFHNGQLLAQGLLKTETLQDEFTRQSRVQSTIGGVVVAPAARGCGMMGALVHKWLEHAAQDGAATAHARVRVANEKSWKIFLAHNFAITGQGPSPDAPAQQVFHLNLNLNLRDAAPAARQAITHAPAAAGIADYLAQGYIATGWDKNARHFKMALNAQPA